MPPEPFDPISDLDAAYISFHLMYTNMRQAGFGLLSASVVLGTYIYQLVNSNDKES